jgi:diacylglycerol kinase family enzyme
MGCFLHTMAPEQVDRTMEIGVITNPKSRKNKSKQNRAAVLQSIVGDLGMVHQTACPESIKPILREFLRKRARFWVSDGGDGALHWMLRMGLEVLEEEEFAGISLPLALPTNGGTIDFVAHNVGIRGTAESILNTLRSALENGETIEEVEVDSMHVEGTEVTSEGERSFRTLGFAAAVGGVGQRVFTKYYEAEDPSPKTIVGVVGKTIASYPVAMSPLRHLPGMPRVLRQYAREVFKPTQAQITLDGQIISRTACTGIHIGSMSIDLGGVFRFFSTAEVPGQMHAIIGSPTPLEIILNLPRMHMGQRMVGKDLYDGPCRHMTIEAIGGELLEPVIDGEIYRNIRTLSFEIGPRVRIPKVVGRKASQA